MKATLGDKRLVELAIQSGLTLLIEHGMLRMLAGLAGVARPERRLFDNQGDGACPSDDVRR